MYLKVFFLPCIIFVMIFCTLAAPKDLDVTTSKNDLDQKPSSIVEEINVVPENDEKNNIARTAKAKKWKFQPDSWNDTEIEIFRTSNDDHNCITTIMEPDYPSKEANRKNNNQTQVSRSNVATKTSMWIFTIILISIIKNSSENAFNLDGL